MTRTVSLLLFLAVASFSGFARADGFAYPHPGDLAAQTIVYATSNGINAYYMGSTASFDDQIEVYDVQTGYNSGRILDNKTTLPGTELAIGTGAGEINAGDQLVFFIDSPLGRYASVASDSLDRVNHAYIAPFSGAMVNLHEIPPGLFVGMEDVPLFLSDLNYNDDNFVFTGVTPAAATAEPASLALLGTGLLGGLWLRRKGKEA
jgi:hypothetical protein